MYTLNTTAQTFPSPNSSILSKNDRNFIEFTRCLYKAKFVVEELQDFSTTVTPILCPPTMYHENSINSDDLIRYVKQYLDESIQKFNQMCKILLAILYKLESDWSVRKERIDSFRQEVLGECRKAENIKYDLIKLVCYSMNKEVRGTEKHKTDKTMDNTSDHYDDSQSFTTSSETTPEPVSDSF